MSNLYLIPQGSKYIRAQSPVEIPDTFSNDLLKDFDAIIHAYFKYLYKPIWFDIFKKRFGIGNEKQLSMHEIGKIYNFTRERARQIVFIVTFHLKQLLEGYDIKSPRIYCDSGKFQFKSFKEDLSLNGKIIVYSKVKKIIEKYSKDILNYPDSYIDLLMFIYGYETSSYNGVKFYYKGCLKNFLRTIQTLRLFMSKQVFPISEEAIIKKLRINKNELESFMSFIGVEVQKTNEGIFYQTHIKDLFNNCLKVYRILHEAGHPMHLLEIKNKLIEKGDNSLIFSQNKYWRDKIVSIGRSGKWALKEWKIETAPILKLLIKVFRKNKRIMSSRELFNELSQMREVSFESVQSILGIYSNIFSHYRKGLYGLKEWSLPFQEVKYRKLHYSKELKRDIIINKVVKILEEKGKVELQDLIAKLTEWGFNKSSVYSIINRKKFLFKKEFCMDKRKKYVSLQVNKN